MGLADRAAMIRNDRPRSRTASLADERRRVLEALGGDALTGPAIFGRIDAGRLAHSGDQAHLYPALYSLEAGWRLRAAWRPGPDGVRHRTYRRRSLIPHRAGSAKPR